MTSSPCSRLIPDLFTLIVPFFSIEKPYIKTSKKFTRKAKSKRVRFRPSSFPEISCLTASTAAIGAVVGAIRRLFTQAPITSPIEGDSEDEPMDIEDRSATRAPSVLEPAAKVSPLILLGSRPMTSSSSLLSLNQFQHQQTKGLDQCLLLPVESLCHNHDLSLPLAHAVSASMMSMPFLSRLIVTNFAPSRLDRYS